MTTNLEVQMYKMNYLIRRVEEKICEVYELDYIKSPVHLSVGQEWPSVSICSALRTSDVVYGTYRGHALYLAKGGSLDAMICELYGKASGLGQGRAGSMHLADHSVNMMGTSAIVSTTIPHAVGHALALKQQGCDDCVAVFFGDGATEEGVFWESINFASLNKLNVIFVCENNFYAIHTPLESRVGSSDLVAKVEAFGIESVRHSGNCTDLYYLVENYLELAREGKPFFVEVETYRYLEHVGPNSDWHLGYRTEVEGKQWMKKDQLKWLESVIDISPSQVSELRAEIDERVETAFINALNSSDPDPRSIFLDVLG